MNDLETLNYLGVIAVKKLREAKHAAGLPFMINSNDLPSTQSYLEFPDKTIKLVEVAPDKHSFTVLSELKPKQADAIRQLYNLP